MRRIFVLLSLMLFLNGCAEVAMLGTSIGGASSGKIAQTSFNSGLSYGVKKTTGKTPIGHALTYVKENNSKKKEHCTSFVREINTEICKIVKKKMALTKAKLENEEKLEESTEEFVSILQPAIDKKFKIKYLDN